MVAATSRNASFYRAVLFGNAATEDVTKVLGSSGKRDYTVLGTTTGDDVPYDQAGSVEVDVSLRVVR